jgi:cell division cycle 20-like protein 1 (cofactor of APC complex)
VGLTNGKVLVLDATTCQPVSEAAHHSDRVGCLAWNPSLGVLGSGSRDHRVVLCDPRGGAVQEYAHHTQEVCGLRWSTCGNFIASGGDDGQLCVWSTALAQRPLLQTPLTAPVRALAWSPHAHGLLACGGGAADRRLHFFNAVAATPLASVDTGAQVCALLWAPNVNEIVSAHGDQNTEVVVWKYPRLTPVATLSGHRSRVLWLTGSPDGTTLVTGAGDETLRFWDVFPPARPQRTVTHSALSLSLSLSTIR